MAIYKGVEIDPVLLDLIRHMQSVDDYREVLGRLQASWDTLSLLGQLTGTAAEMSGTREAFEKLTGDLLNHLGQETRRKVVADLRAKSQNGLDILVRNLFERTADIGFIAADATVMAFLETGDDSPEARAVMEARFKEYVAKYSVYSDIILVDAAGNVRAQLVPGMVEQSSHDVVREAATTRAAYVEHYGEIDVLGPGKHLVYAYRIQGRTGVLGSVILAFRLADEMAGIYAKLIDDSDWTILATTTADGEVIASSSPLQIPAGARLPKGMLKAQGDLVRFSGRQYLAVASEATGYQGYRGPGWLSIALIPVEAAFDSRDSRILEKVDGHLLENLMIHSSLFTEALRAIPRKAAEIQQDLNRSVWNGSVRQAETLEYNAAFSKTLLWEISNAGRKTQAVFEQSIGNLHETVVAAVLQNALYRAAFAIDVMDRNLYERANDCRWWALTDMFREALSRGRHGDAAGCAKVLRTINDLYTVYSNLILFDSGGVVMAVSDAAQQELVGTQLTGDWVTRTMSLRNSQSYAVSPFTATSLYGERPTYVFAATVRDPSNNRPVGGVAIVFDSAPQFEAMLSDALPRDDAGAVVEGSFALFVRRDGTVVSSSDPRFAVGTASGLEGIVTGLSAGEGGCQVIPLEGHYYAVGAVMSAGYREYKVTDGYQDDVAAICAMPIGKAEAHSVVIQRETRTTRIRKSAHGVATVELATFHVGRHWFAVPAANVVEAVDLTQVTPAPSAFSGAVVGYKRHRDALVPLLRLDRLMDISGRTGEPTQAVVVQVEGGLPVGLLVDSLGEVPEISASDILPLGDMLVDGSSFAKGIVSSLSRDDGHVGMLTMLDLDRISAQVTAGRSPTRLAS